MSRHMDFASTGGLTGLRKIEAEMTGFANFGGEDYINARLAAAPDEADAVIRAMQEAYGQEKLEQMTPSEFYRLYKDFSMG